MSYARCSSPDSDIYLYLGQDWYLSFCKEEQDWPTETFTTLGSLLRRLQELNASGVRVPWHTFERIKHEIVTNRFVIKDGRKHCPYCQSFASNVLVSTELGDELDNHYHCPLCRAEEIVNPDRPDKTRTELETLMLWYEPPADSWYWDQTRLPEEEIPF